MLFCVGWKENLITSSLSSRSKFEYQESKSDFVSTKYYHRWLCFCLTFCYFYSKFSTQTTRIICHKDMQYYFFKHFSTLKCTWKCNKSFRQIRHSMKCFYKELCETPFNLMSNFYNNKLRNILWNTFFLFLFFWNQKRYFISALIKIVFVFFSQRFLATRFRYCNSTALDSSAHQWTCR